MTGMSGQGTFPEPFPGKTETFHFVHFVNHLNRKENR